MNDKNYIGSQQHWEDSVQADIDMQKSIDAEMNKQIQQQMEQQDDSRETNPDDEDDQMLEQCPHCGSIWGCEEMDFQECDCCGYPDADRPYDEDAWDDTEGAEWMDDDQDLPDFNTYGEPSEDDLPFP